MSFSDEQGLLNGHPPRPRAGTLTLAPSTPTDGALNSLSEIDEDAESTLITNLEKKISPRHLSRHSRQQSCSRADAMSAFSDLYHNTNASTSGSGSIKNSKKGQPPITFNNHRDRPRPSLANVAFRVRALNRAAATASTRSLMSNSGSADTGSKDSVEHRSPAQPRIDEMHSTWDDFRDSGVPPMAPFAPRGRSYSEAANVMPGSSRFHTMNDKNHVSHTGSPFAALGALSHPRHRSTKSSTEFLFENVEKLDMLFQSAHRNDHQNGTETTFGGAAPQKPYYDSINEDRNDMRSGTLEAFSWPAGQTSNNTDIENGISKSNDSSDPETIPLTYTAISVDEKPTRVGRRSFLASVRHAFTMSYRGDEREERRASKVGLFGISRMLNQFRNFRGRNNHARHRRKPSSPSSLHITLWDILDPDVLFKTMVMDFLQTTALYVLLPCMVVAPILFYTFGNPRIDFLPSNAPLSWWLIFFVRQCLMLHMARCTEYVLVEALALRSAIYLRLFGPLVTLFVIQAKGWPFTVTAWSLWDLLLVHDSNRFARHWLYFTNIAMFSDANSSDGILSSESYFRILLALIFAGVAASIKRTYLALYLGKRTFVHYKPHLNRVIGDMKLLAEVADLATETDSPEFENVLSLADHFIGSPPGTKQKASVVWDIHFQDDQRELKREDSSDVSASDIETTGERSDHNDDDTSGGSPAMSLTESEDEEDQNKQEVKSIASKTMTGAAQFQAIIANRSFENSGLRSECIDQNVNQNHFAEIPLNPTKSTEPSISSGHLHLKRLLDRWEEPVNKASKTAEPSMHDILQFRKALSYMEDTHPFSLSFGRANTRDNCIRSSLRLYKKLLKYTPETATLPFSVLGALAYDNAGQLNEHKNKSLLRLFRPDKNDEVSSLAYVQSCDGVYKRLRFFLASVGNSATIDRVLEQIVNTAFYLILVLVILSILKFNPWTLLVSLSTLCVSFAFAFGPSTAKYIDGILLIAIRRPYDLGDRVSFSPAESQNVMPGQTWFVEDITLASTTLRFAATNEVSTINNASIANSRIFNGTRSPRALVGVNILFNVDTTFEDVQKFRSHIEQYIKERSRQWVALVFFRSQNIDLSKGAVEYMVKLQHRKSWQEEAIICQSRADLMNCCDAFAEKLGIRFTPGPGSMEVQLKEPQRDLQPEVIDNGSTRWCHLDNSFARPDNTPRRSVSGNQTMLNGSLGIATAQKP